MKLRKLLLLLLSIVAMTGFTACDDEDNPHTSPLVGVWQFDDPYDYYATNRFIFDANGFGEYAGINEFGQWDSWDITWESRSGSQLTVYFPQSHDVWEYYYQFRDGYLVLTDVVTGSEQWYYRYR